MALPFRRNLPSSENESVAVHAILGCIGSAFSATGTPANAGWERRGGVAASRERAKSGDCRQSCEPYREPLVCGAPEDLPGGAKPLAPWRSEEHTSELQSQSNLVCRLLLEKKKK